MSLKLPVYKIGNLNKKTSTVECDETLFGREFNRPLVHQLIKVFTANGHTGTKESKNRANVAGGGIKPRRQKGTGKARLGTLSSPILRGGGMTFAFDPSQMTSKKQFNKKMYRGALLSILSEKLRLGEIKIVDTFSLKSHKTSEFATIMDSSQVSKAYLIANEPEDNLILATRNLYGFQIGSVNQIDILKLYRSECVLLDRSSFEILEKRYEA
ncbi:MAG: 50S ribosomal protein L4 [Legionellales bacterium]|nr:50S ribosomal protein L4 [Legionellales bacterium]|tara:strand:- start:433 stop:1071 length:639 start_codon:yes stop_codon:yes gene_type:complete